MASEMAVWADTAPSGEERKPSSRPVDLVHLSRYTLGERALEREVLELFCIQSLVYLERLRAPSPTRTGRTPLTRSKAQPRRSAPGVPPKQPSAPKRCRAKS